MCVDRDKCTHTHTQRQREREREVERQTCVRQHKCAQTCSLAICFLATAKNNAEGLKAAAISCASFSGFELLTSAQPSEATCSRLCSHPACRSLSCSSGRQNHLAFALTLAGSHSYDQVRGQVLGLRTIGPVELRQNQHGQERTRLVARDVHSKFWGTTVYLARATAIAFRRQKHCGSAHSHLPVPPDAVFNTAPRTTSLWRLVAA